MNYLIASRAAFWKTRALRVYVCQKNHESQWSIVENEIACISGMYDWLTDITHQSENLQLTFSFQWQTDELILIKNLFQP